MSKERAMKVLNEMAAGKVLSGDVVSVIFSQFDEINLARRNAQAAADLEYHHLKLEHPSQ